MAKTELEELTKWKNISHLTLLNSSYKSINSEIKKPNPFLEIMYRFLKKISYTLQKCKDKNSPFLLLPLMLILSYYKTSFLSPRSCATNEESHIKQ
jgi:hypothetical protein